MARRRGIPKHGRVREDFAMFGWRRERNWAPTFSRNRSTNPPARLHYRSAGLPRNLSVRRPPKSGNCFAALHTSPTAGGPLAADSNCPAMTGFQPATKCWRKNLAFAYGALVVLGGERGEGTRTNRDGRGEKSSRTQLNR